MREQALPTLAENMCSASHNYQRVLRRAVRIWLPTSVTIRGTVMGIDLFLKRQLCSLRCVFSKLRWKTVSTAYLDPATFRVNSGVVQVKSASTKSVSGFMGWRARGASAKGGETIAKTNRPQDRCQPHAIAVQWIEGGAVLLPSWRAWK